MSENSIMPVTRNSVRALFGSATFVPRRRYRARSHPWAFVYLTVRRLFELFLLLCCRSEQSELIVWVRRVSSGSRGQGIVAASCLDNNVGSRAE